MCEATYPFIVSVLGIQEPGVIGGTVLDLLIAEPHLAVCLVDRSDYDIITLPRVEDIYSKLCLALDMVVGITTAEANAVVFLLLQPLSNDVTLWPDLQPLIIIWDTGVLIYDDHLLWHTSLVMHIVK